ncbi:unnamed protein product, partial [Rotaria socialis]
VQPPIVQSVVSRATSTIDYTRHRERLAKELKDYEDLLTGDFVVRFSSCVLTFENRSSSSSSIVDDDVDELLLLLLLLYEAHTPGIKTELRTMEILRAETNEFPHLKVC